MSRTIAVFTASVMGALAMAGPFSRRADAQIVVEFPVPAFLATVQPVYYDNHASYWWHNRWVWRDGGGWHSYDHEPPFLAQRRLHSPPGRWFYAHHDVHGGGNFGHDVHGGHGGHVEPRGGGHGGRR